MSTRDTESANVGSAAVTGHSGSDIVGPGTPSGVQGLSGNSETAGTGPSEKSNAVDTTETSKSTETGTGTSGDLPKAKRNRAKGETLAFLKKQFDLNPNPSSSQRRKISELVGMPEKNVRIWFQNRRAKHRKKFGSSSLAGRQSRSDADWDTAAATTTTNIDGLNTKESELTFFDRIPVNINHNYYFIDVCSITVGSWNRMKSGSLRSEDVPRVRDISNLSPMYINEIMSNATDLMVLISRKNLEINYFFSAMANSTKILFRVFFPINSIAKCSLTLETTNSDIIAPAGNQYAYHGPANGDSSNDPNESQYNSYLQGQSDTVNRFGELQLMLMRSPKFAVYFLDDDPDLSTNQWSICEDFSEGKQVTDAFIGGSNIPHTLKGLQNSLKFMNSLILDYNSTTNNPMESLPPYNSNSAIGSNNAMNALTSASMGLLRPGSPNNTMDTSNTNSFLNTSGSNNMIPNAQASMETANSTMFNMNQQQADIQRSMAGQPPSMMPMNQSMGQMYRPVPATNNGSLNYDMAYNSYMASGSPLGVPGITGMGIIPSLDINKNSTLINSDLYNLRSNMSPYNNAEVQANIPSTNATNMGPVEYHGNHTNKGNEQQIKRMGPEAYHHNVSVNPTIAHNGNPTMNNNSSHALARHNVGPSSQQQGNSHMGMFHHNGDQSLSLGQESEFPATPDFFRNSTELTEDNKWL